MVTEFLPFLGARFFFFFFFSFAKNAPRFSFFFLTTEHCCEVSMVTRWIGCHGKDWDPPGTNRDKIVHTKSVLELNFVTKENKTSYK